MRFVKCRSIETTNRTLLGVLFQEENGNDVVASCERGVGEVIVYTSTMKWCNTNTKLNDKEIEMVIEQFKDKKTLYFEQND